MLRFRGTLACFCLVAGLGWACADPPEDSEFVLDTGDFAQASGAVYGIAHDPDGIGLAGAHVTTDPHGYEATAGADGSYRVQRLPQDTYALVVALPGFDTQVVEDVVVDARSEVEVDVSLTPSVSTSGRVEVLVQGPDGVPLEGAFVRDGDGQEVVTDAAGVAVLAGLAGATVDVSVADADDALWGRTVRGVDVPAAGVVDLAVQLSGRPSSGSFSVGSEVCANCHPDHAADLAGTPHGRALATAVEEPLATRFATGATVDLAHGTAVLDLDGSSPVVTLTASGGESRDFEVAGVIGDVGIGGIPFTELGDQAYPLPVAWVAADEQFDGWPEAAARLVPWEEETWLTDEGTFAFAAGSRPVPSLSAEARCFACHANGFTLAERADGGVDMTPHFGSGPRWAEPAVTCERCHGPGSSHVGASADERPLRITRPDLLDAERANEVCAQCHSRLEGVGNGLPYPYASGTGLFRPGQVLADYGVSVFDPWPSGASSAPNAQADEMSLSAHGPGGAYAVRCHDCHDPHGSSRDAGDEPLPHSLRLDARDNTLCTSCHLALTFDGDPDAIVEHQGHFSFEPAADSHRGRCVRCHMPRTATRTRFSDVSGAGDIASHRFIALSPQETLDAFEAVRLDVLPLGHFPIHSCSECHEYNAWRFEQNGWTFIGPRGDPTRIETHEAYLDGWEAKFP